MVTLLHRLRKDAVKSNALKVRSLATPQRGGGGPFFSGIFPFDEVFGMLFTLLVCLILQMALLGCGGEGSETEPIEPILKQTTASPPVSGEPFMIKTTHGLLTAEITGSPLQAVLEEIARRNNIRIYLDAPADEIVTATFHNLPIEDGIHMILYRRNVAFIYSIARLEEVHILKGDASWTSPKMHLFPKKDKQAPEVLAQVLLEDEKRGSRKRAVEELGRMWDTDVIEPLSRAVLEDDDPSVREAAARVLGETWNENAVDPLTSALLGDQDSFVREAAVRALGETWSQAAIDPLKQALLHDPGRYVREASAFTLGEIGGENAVEVLVQALQDKDGSVRESAAKSLGAVGSLQAIDALIKTSLSDKDIWVREKAAEAAVKILGR